MRHFFCKKERYFLWKHSENFYRPCYSINTKMWIKCFYDLRIIHNPMFVIHSNKKCRGYVKVVIELHFCSLKKLFIERAIGPIWEH